MNILRKVWRKQRLLRLLTTLTLFLWCIVLTYQMCHLQDFPPASPLLSAVAQQQLRNDTLLHSPRLCHLQVDTEGRIRKQPIRSVHSYKESFPDLNDVQLATACHIGVPPVANRAAADSMRDKLIYIGSNPYFTVRQLQRSIPYLVPHAYLVLQEISRAFIDSLQSKHMPPHLLVVTSVLRTEEDVTKLRRYNRNASVQSAHRYGTTFDISYLHYYPIAPLGGGTPRVSRNDSLKWVLSEVLRDQRNRGLCYVKYEVHQSCFHITAR